MSVADSSERGSVSVMVCVSVAVMCVSRQRAALDSQKGEQPLSFCTQT